MFSLWPCQLLGPFLYLFLYVSKEKKKPLNLVIQVWSLWDFGGGQSSFLFGCCSGRGRPCRKEGPTRPGLGKCGWDCGVGVGRRGVHVPLRKKNLQECSYGAGPGWGHLVARSLAAVPRWVWGAGSSCWSTLSLQARSARLVGQVTELLPGPLAPEAGVGSVWSRARNLHAGGDVRDLLLQRRR